jgi:NAD(P)-dependent dehydrogenase (short-subunit alcohol dehydrogenase family)
MRPKDEDFVMPSMRLDGRVALVTGGSRGLGFGVALALAQVGADVALVSRGAEELERAGDLIRGLGRRVLTIPADIVDPGAAEHIVTRTMAEFGRIDVLVHGAGVNVRKPATDFSREDWQHVLRINVEAAFFLSQAAAPIMRAQGQGRIICIGSVAAEVAVPNVTIYAISKSGMKGMVRQLAIEWAKQGITVNAIAPGRFWTAMTDAVFSNPLLYESAVRVIPLGRPGVPADLAGAAVLLATDAGAYITGQTILVDGGWTASSGVEA